MTETSIRIRLAMSRALCFLLGHSITEMRYDSSLYTCQCCGDITAPTLHTWIRRKKRAIAKKMEPTPYVPEEMLPEELLSEADLNELTQLRQAAELARQQRRR